MPSGVYLWLCVCCVYLLITVQWFIFLLLARVGWAEYVKKIKKMQVFLAYSRIMYATHFD